MNRERSYPRVGRFSPLAIVFLAITGFMLACNYVANLWQSHTDASTQAYQETKLVQTIEKITQAANEAPTDSGENPQLTSMITETPTPVAFLSLSPDERMLKAAKILLFEDMSASGYERYVKTALDRGGYFYLDVGSAKGWFKSQLLSSEDWDLIIASAEARRDFGGEYFEYLDQRVMDGAALIVEFGDFDFAPAGKSQILLDRCGVEFQSDWYEPDLRMFYWLIPDHPIFHHPNEIPANLGNAEPLWGGDYGDLMRIKLEDGQPNGDAQLLAGTNPSWLTDHATLLTCLEGRMIVQTFASHEYKSYNMVPLWQNYIYYVLSNRFASFPPQVPTPMMTQMPPPISSTDQAAVNGNCEGIISGRILETPHFQAELFEHHAQGIFIYFRIELVNQSSFPIRIWDGDYSLEGILGVQQVVVPLHQAATGYLYIESPSHLWQDLIQPGQTWQTRLAFDAAAGGHDWVLVIKPGSEFEEQICQMRIPLRP